MFNAIRIIISRNNNGVGGVVSSNGRCVNDKEITEGIVRVKTSFDEPKDVFVGVGQTFSVNDPLHDVLKDCKGHPTVDKDLEERIFKVKWSSSNVIILEQDDAKKQKVGVLFRMAKLENGDILEVESAKRLIPTSFELDNGDDEGCLSD